MREAPLVAVCLATFEPDLRLFERQVASIRGQTHERLRCLVRDDASAGDVFEAIVKVCDADSRFTVVRGDARAGYYRNFEACLGLVPEEAELVALSDQDDVWHPDKLETLLTAFADDDVTLAYSDMNIVTERGDVVERSFWTERRNNYSSLSSLLLANTVTGAASVFRRELLDDALPFPPPLDDAYHDHWIACVALALGRIVFVDRPLHDYVQHGRNVVGSRPVPPDSRGGAVNAARRFLREPRRRWQATVTHARSYYERDVVLRERFARTLEERLDGRLPERRARDVRRVAGLSSSAASLAWLLARSVRDVHGRSETLGIENQLIKGVLWHRLDRARRRLARTRRS